MLNRSYPCVFLWFAVLLGLGQVQRALGQQSPKDLEVADCARVIRPDSIHLFFDGEYALVPPGCALVRRETRMDAATGTFLGEVRDYWVADNGLVHKVHYAQGLREGAYEAHHRNQQVAVRGQFTQGQPVGTWQYWYASGKPWQTMEMSRTEPLRIVAYWDSTGRQRVVGGEGTWEEVRGGRLPTRTTGRVTDGLMEGTWERRSLLDKQVLTSEDYQAGRLREGRQYIGTAGKPRKYQDESLLGPQAGDASAPMEPFHFGKSCEEQAARAAATAAQKAWAASAVIVGPKPPGEPSAYQRKLLERLHNFNTLTQWMPRTDGQTTVITADVDATGRLSNFASASGVLSSAFASIMTSLGTWHPATVNRLPVPGKIRITLAMYSTQLQSSLQSHVAYPLPREVLQTAK